MKIFDFIKEKLQVEPILPDRVHPVFGDLVFEGVGDNDDIWQSETLFIPLNREIGINGLNLCVYLGQ